LKSKAVLL